MSERMSEAKWQHFFEHDFALLRIGSKEWNAAWKGLAEFSGDEDRMARDPESFEVWQYMGTVRKKRVWRHEFRHRWHPLQQRRWYLQVPATSGWKPDDEKRKWRTVTPSRRTEARE